MGKIIIFLLLPPYLRDWMIHKFGNPVVLPKSSVENKEICFLLQKGPKNKAPDIGVPDSLRMEVCYISSHALFLSEENKNYLCKRFTALFDADFWKYMINLDESHEKINDRVYRYMELNGINIDHWDTLAKKYLRWRDKYKKHNINIK